jgi:hypothetical protein
VRPVRAEARGGLCVTGDRSPMTRLARQSAACAVGDRLCESCLSGPSAQWSRGLSGMARGRAERLGGREE